jgi:predicted TIM-barrel fold metal-dependent hydrolase
MKLCMAWPGLLCAVSMLAACGGPSQPGVEVNGERLAVVDMHLHAGTWDDMTPWFQRRLTERVPRGFKWTLKLLSDRTLSGPGILGELDRAGISGGGVFALYSPHTTGVASNQFIESIVETSPQRLFGFASIRVYNWNVDGERELAQLEADLQGMPHMVGIKLAHAHQQFRFDDERFYGIYEIAGRLGKPIYLHTATSPNPGTRLEPPYTDPAYLEDAIRRYPSAVFILGHAGWDSYNKKLTYVDTCIELAKRYDNVYMEPGALGARRAVEVLPDFLRRIKAADAANKLIYGSDGPQFPTYVKRHLEAFVTGMLDAGFTTDEMRMILSGNFTRVFGLPDFEV